MAGHAESRPARWALMKVAVVAVLTSGGASTKVGEPQLGFGIGQRAGLGQRWELLLEKPWDRL